MRISNFIKVIAEISSEVHLTDSIVLIDVSVSKLARDSAYVATELLLVFDSVKIFVF